MYLRLQLRHSHGQQALVSRSKMNLNCSVRSGGFLLSRDSSMFFGLKDMKTRKNDWKFSIVSTKSWKIMKKDDKKNTDISEFQQGWIPVIQMALYEYLKHWRFLNECGACQGRPKKKVFAFQMSVDTNKQTNKHYWSWSSSTYKMKYRIHYKFVVIIIYIYSCIYIYTYIYIYRGFLKWGYLHHRFYDLHHQVTRKTVMLSCPRFLKPKQHRAHRRQKGGSINGGTLKWMADRTGGYPHDLGNLHMWMSTTNTYQNIPKREDVWTCWLIKA